MSGFYPQIPTDTTVVNQVPIGGIAAVLRSGDAYKAVGEVVSRTTYPALSAAFPRNGSFSSIQATLDGAPAYSTMIWNAIAAGSAGFVIVGGSDAGSAPGPVQFAQFSADGKSWVMVALPNVASWRSVTFGNGKYVAVGYTGTISTPTAAVCATSTDGRVWKTSSLPDASAYFAVAHNGSVFCAIAYGTNKAATSPDGVTWTPRTLPAVTTWAKIAASAGGLFLAASLTTAGATSPDGVTWTPRTLPAANISCLAYGGGAFLATSTGSANQVNSSVDGATWVTRQTPYAAPNAACYGNGVWVLRSGVYVMTSIDLVTFELRKSIYVDAAMAAYNNGQFVFPASASLVADACCAENTVNSDYLYLSGTAGQFIRVK